MASVFGLDEFLFPVSRDAMEPTALPTDPPVSLLLEGKDEGDQLEGSHKFDQIYGHGGEDQLMGLEGNDTLYGGGGSDRLEGNHGEDVLFGGRGSDTLYGGTGKDMLHGGQGHDQVIGGLGHDLLFGGAGHDRLEGGVGSDQVFGEAGHDRVSGGNGDDTLGGGTGADVLTGGAGQDSFLFFLGWGTDRITDYEKGDTLYLHQDLVDAGLSMPEIIDLYGQVIGDNLVFTFGLHDRLILDGFTDMNGVEIEVFG